MTQSGPMTYSGYIVPAEDENAKGYDKKTGIHTSKDGKESLLVTIKKFRFEDGKQVKENGVYVYDKDTTYVHPADGKKFTDEEKSIMKPEKGYNFHVNHDVDTNRTYDGKGEALFGNVRLYNRYGPAINRNSFASHEAFNVEYPVQEKARKAGAERRRDKYVKAHEEWVDSLEKVSGSVSIMSEPWHAYDKKYDAIVTKLEVKPVSLNVDQELLDDDRGTLNVTFPYSKDEPSFSYGDEISLKDVGMYVNQKGHVNLFKNDSKGIEITEKNGKQIEKETLLADLSKDNLYEQADGSYAAYFYKDDIKEVDGDEMAWRANQTVVSLTAEQAEPLKKELEKYDQVPVVIEGKKTFGKTRSNKVRDEFDLTQGEGSIQIDHGGAMRGKNDNKALEENATEEKAMAKAKSTRSRAQR